MYELVRAHGFVCVLSCVLSFVRACVCVRA